jgi:type II secretory pathway component GspD/PulD (secretin)
VASPPDYFAPGYQAKFSFDNAPLTDALKALSDSFGFQVLPMVPITGNITVISSYPVSTEDALTLAEIALKSNGYFIQRIGHTIKIYAMPDNAAAAPSVTGAVPGLVPAASQPADGQQ